MKYGTIVADPPWTPIDGRPGYVRPDYGRMKAQPQKHYSTMELAEIQELKPPPADHLWLWGLSQHLDWAWETARAWGYEPLTVITWCKPGLGAGRFQSNTEHVLLCRRGGRRGGPAFGMTHGTWFNWPRGRHSEKPDAFYDLVESASPAPYVELFARRARFGWDYWGNESLGTVEIAV